MHRFQNMFFFLRACQIFLGVLESSQHGKHVQYKSTIIEENKGTQK